MTSNTTNSMNGEKIHKPPKEITAFPLCSHGSGKWVKKIDGKLRYFGRWEDPDGVLREYEDFVAGSRHGQQSC